VRLRRGFLRLAAGVAVVAVLAACSGQVEDVTEGVDQVSRGASTVRACTSILGDLASIGGQDPSAADVADGAEKLSQTAEGMESATLQDAANTLADKLREIAEELEADDVAAAEQTLRDATGSIREVARACGLPVGEVNEQLGLNFENAGGTPA
jgi:hypothetical protein